jgi:hypothetical protein
MRELLWEERGRSNTVNVCCSAIDREEEPLVGKDHYSVAACLAADILLREVKSTSLDKEERRRLGLQTEKRKINRSPPPPPPRVKGEKAGWLRATMKKKKNLCDDKYDWKETIVK